MNEETQKRKELQKGVESDRGGKIVLSKFAKTRRFVEGKASLDKIEKITA